MDGKKQNSNCVPCVEKTGERQSKKKKQKQKQSNLPYFPKVTEEKFRNLKRKTSQFQNMLEKFKKKILWIKLDNKSKMMSVHFVK